MINIEILKKRQSEEIVYFKISGHSEAAQYGEDIVCAAVSSVSQMTLNGLLEIVQLKNIKYEESEGLIICDLRFSDFSENEYEKAAVLIESMYSYLKELAKEYAEYVKLIIKEV